MRINDHKNTAHYRVVGYQDKMCDYYLLANYLQLCQCYCELFSQLPLSQMFVKKSVMSRELNCLQTERDITTTLPCCQSTSTHLTGNPP